MDVDIFFSWAIFFIRRSIAIYSDFFAVLSTSLMVKTRTMVEPLQHFFCSLIRSMVVKRVICYSNFTLHWLKSGIITSGRYTWILSIFNYTSEMRSNHFSALYIILINSVKRNVANFVVIKILFPNHIDFAYAFSQRYQFVSMWGIAVIQQRFFFWNYPSSHCESMA